MNPLDELVSEEDIRFANEIFGIGSEPLPTEVPCQPWHTRVTTRRRRTRHTRRRAAYFIISHQQTPITQLEGTTTSLEEAMLSKVLDDELQCIMRRQEFNDLMAGRVQFLVATLTPPSFRLTSYATPEYLPQKYKV